MVTPPESVDDEPRTETCDVEGCPNPIVEVPGKMAPKAALGLHKKREHGISSATPKGPRNTRSRAPRAAESPITLAGVTDRVAATGGKKAPTQDQLAKTFARLYGYGVTGIWSIILEGDPELQDRDAFDAALDMVAPTAEQALATTKPFARIASSSKLNAKYGRAVVDNADVIDAIVAIMEQGRNARAYFRSRSVGAAHPPTGIGTGPAPGPGAERQGIIVTREMLEQQRRDAEGHA